MTTKLKSEAEIRFRERYRRLSVRVNADEYREAQRLGINLSNIARNAVLNEIERRLNAEN